MYLLTIFIAITLRGMKAFLLNFLVRPGGEGGEIAGGQFLHIIRYYDNY